MAEALSPTEQARVDAGKANAVRERAALKNTGPVVRTTDATTGKVSDKAVPEGEPQRLGVVHEHDTDTTTAEGTSAT